MTLDLTTTLQHIERNGEALIAAAEANPTAMVRACTEWNATELAIHTTGVHRRVAHWCTGRLQKPERWPDHEPADLNAPWQWCRDGLDLVIAALQDIGPEESVWTWTDRKNGGFYHRRMLQETAVHRWDAQDAAGTPSPIEAEVATDGINELCDVGLRFRGDGSAIDYPKGDVLLERTDGTDRWRIRAMDGTLLIAQNGDAGTSADATVQGHAEDLLLWFWGRGGQVTISGNTDVAEAWAAMAP
ncbi:MAG: maleylpyruvate isomerase family mycothiol-dependent enzyme [Acidimicrobiales bacterium]|jgi:uncharacterized protein (TIGR03083 family)|nr:maleylpyruvate isomerase family mycothiol-dependent enzyme [Acidimicrobiales bacterium]